MYRINPLVSIIPKYKVARVLIVAQRTFSLFRPKHLTAIESNASTSQSPSIDGRKLVAALN